MSQPTDPAPASSRVSPSSSTSAPAHGSPASPARPASRAQKPPRLALLIATGFGLGYLPKAPGTWGSLAGVLLFWVVDTMQRVRADPPRTSSSVMMWFLEAFWLHLLVVGVVALGGWWSAWMSSRDQGNPDAQWIVVDEISGQLTTLTIAAWPQAMAIISILPDNKRLFAVNNDLIYLAGGANWQYLLAGFILFRVFDIWKPWPVRAAEKLPGGWGIMGDDCVAGMYAALCLWGLRALGI